MELLSNNPDYTERDTVNELEMNSLLSNSFANVPTVGMRHAPEIILLELFREVFFEKRSPQRKIKELEPDSGEYSKHEKVVLDVLRGRARKKTNNANEKYFFAPAYPSLAENAWPRMSDAAVIKGLLLNGPIATHLWCGVGTDEKKELHENFKKELFSALVGNNSFYFESQEKDILSVALKDVDYVINKELAISNIDKKTGVGNLVMDIGSDELSHRIFDDLFAICKLEGKVPRMQWLEMLMTFLRFVMPMWFLAQMKITVLLHGWLIDTIDSGKSIDQETIIVGIRQRNLKLLDSSMLATSGIFEATKTYMKKRIELNCILYDLTDIREKEMSKERLVIKKDCPTTELSIIRLLEIAEGAADDLKSLSPCQTYGNSVSRKTEKYPAYRNPLKSGQGKNIDEIFLVLRKYAKGDESGGHLLNPFDKATRFSVFPGQLLLKTITVLANYRKTNKNSGLKGGGQMMLGDIEKHFQEYGIDYYLSDDARPKIIETLKNMGLLSGSPDAGSNIAVTSPYHL